MRSSLGIAVAVLVVLSGCAGLLGTDSGGATTDDGTVGSGMGPDYDLANRTETPTPDLSAVEVASSNETPPDNHTADATPGANGTTGDGTLPGGEQRPPPPGRDAVGYEDGYWYDDPLAVNVTTGDGLNAVEFDAVKSRTKARVEFLRDREFEGTIQFDFITREQILDRDQFFQFEEYLPRDQLWEATFVVGENRTVATALEQLYRDVVDGYSVGGRVVFVAENPGSPRVDPATLAHELDHEIDPDVEPNRDLDTWDDRATLRGVSEGTASFVEAWYLQLCRQNWSCIDRPDDANVVEQFDADVGLFLWFAAPYTLGPDLMGQIYERGGNAAVDERFRDPPASMEQFVHPDRYPEDQPTNVTLRDLSRGDWRPTNDHRDELGEVILYAALKANGVIGGPDPRITEDQRTGLNYSHPATTGWDGDAFLAYTNDTHEGYVFASEWDSPEDAREFRRAWTELIRSRGGRKVREGVYRIDSGPFADAIRIRRDGSRVVVVDAPTLEALDDVRSLGD